MSDKKMSWCYKKIRKVNAFFYVVQHVFFKGQLKIDKYFYINFE